MSVWLIFWLMWLGIGLLASTTYFIMCEFVRKDRDQVWGYKPKRQYYCPTFGHITWMIIGSLAGLFLWLVVIMDFFDQVWSKTSLFKTLGRFFNICVCDLFRKKEVDDKGTN